MRQKSFLILAGVTGVSILAAAGSLLIGGGAPAFASAGEKLFPQMQSEAAGIAKVFIRKGEFDMNIELREGQFVDAASGYPVDPEPLKKLVGGITMAEIAEAKTTNPSRHADLQLADAMADEGAGKEIILSREDGDSIAHVVAGQRDFTLGGITGGQFVRRGGEDASWLVHARVEPPTHRAGWFDTRLVDVDTSDLKTAAITTSDGRVISMEMNEGELVLDPLLAVDRVPADNQLTRVGRMFETLDFVDVRAADNGAESSNGSTAVKSTLADGTAILLSEVVTAGEDDSFWVRIKAEGESDRATELRTKTEGFEFALSSADADIFGLTLEDLTEEKPAG